MKEISRRTPKLTVTSTTPRRTVQMHRLILTSPRTTRTSFLTILNRKSLVQKSQAMEKCLASCRSSRTMKLTRPTLRGDAKNGTLMQKTQTSEKKRKRKPKKRKKRRSRSYRIAANKKLALKKRTKMTKRVIPSMLTWMRTLPKWKSRT